MNRVDFMNQLESLLQNIPSTEREEAIQYYNDYFDDAGKENEQEVIEALGNPARVAENIKRDLAVNGCGEGYAQKVKASDRVLMEYGKNVPEDSEENRDSKEIRDSGRVSGSGQTDGGVREQPADMSEGLTEKSAGWQRAGYGASQPTGSATTEYGRGNQNESTEYSGGNQNESTEYSHGNQNTSTEYGQTNQRASTKYGQNSGGPGSQDSHGANGKSWGNPFEDYGSGSSGTWSGDTAGYTPEKHKKRDSMPVWAIAMLITVLIFASPVLGAVALGVLGIILGALGALIGMIFGFGVTAIVLLVVMLVLVVVGIICFCANPWVGIALVGGGLIGGCIGLLFLMLTVALAGIATPAICRAIAFIFRGFKKKRAMAN